MRTLTLPEEQAGTVSWPTPVGSVAWVELRRAGVSLLQRLDLQTDKQTMGTIHLTATRLNGRVMLGGTPLVALVNCGSMAVISSESTGAYRCWTRKTARSVTFVVEPCDGSAPYTHVAASTGTDQEIDIDIPENLLTVDVTDAKTGEPIEKASVTLWHGSPALPGEGDPVRLGETGADGRIARRRLQAEGRLSLCAERDGYERQCRANFTIEKDERTSSSIALARTPGLLGSIAGAGTIESGTISVVRNGFELDSAAVKPKISSTFSS